MTRLEKTFLILLGRIGLRIVGLASEYRLYRGHQMTFHAGLLHESQRSSFHACLDELLFRMHGKENKNRRATRLAEFIHSVNSVQDWHRDISHDDVRKEAASRRDQFCAIGCCPYDIKMGRQESNLGFEQRSVVISQ